MSSTIQYIKYIDPVTGDYMLMDSNSKIAFYNHKKILCRTKKGTLMVELKKSNDEETYEELLETCPDVLYVNTGTETICIDKKSHEVITRYGVKFDFIMKNQYVELYVCNKYINYNNNSIPLFEYDRIIDITNNCRVIVFYKDNNIYCYNLYTHITHLCKSISIGNCIFAYVNDELFGIDLIMDTYLHTNNKINVRNLGACVLEISNALMVIHKDNKLVLINDKFKITLPPTDELLIYRVTSAKSARNI